MCVCEVIHKYLQEKFIQLQFTMKFTLKFTNGVYNEYLIHNEVLTQSYIREKLLLITWHFFLTFTWAERRFMLWWQQTYKSWPGLKHICQWNDKFGAYSENMKRILKSPYFRIKRRKCKIKKDVKLLHILFYCRNPF